MKPSARDTPCGENAVRIVKRSNQDGVRRLSIDAAGDGCFEAVVRSPGIGAKTVCVPPQTVALAERLVKRDAAYQKLVEAVRDNIALLDPIARGQLVNGEPGPARRLLDISRDLLKELGEAP